MLATMGMVYRPYVETVPLGLPRGDLRVPTFHAQAYRQAVWLVSRWVRLEREQCCDDIVLRVRDDPDTYADALLAAARAMNADWPVLGSAGANIWIPRLPRRGSKLTMALAPLAGSTGGSEMSRALGSVKVPQELVKSAGWVMFRHLPVDLRSLRRASTAHFVISLRFSDA